MRIKVGGYLRENSLDIVSGIAGDPLAVKSLGSHQLKIQNFYENFSLEDEKNLEQNSEYIQKTLANSKLSELEANIIIPDEQCSLQIIKLPLVSEKEIISAIELQSEEFVPYPIEKASFDYQVLSIDKENNSMHLLLVVALKENIDRVSDFMLSLGLYPTGLETESTALYRLIFGSFFKLDGKISMIINIGRSATQISILNLSQGQLITTNSINVGSIFFLKALQNNLNIPLPTAIEMFRNLKTTDLHYQKIVQPVFTEFAQQVQKILMAALEKIGTLPSSIYLYSAQTTNTYDLLFKGHPLLQQYKILNFNELSFNPTAILVPEELKKSIGHYLVPLGAII